MSIVIDVFDRELINPGKFKNRSKIISSKKGNQWCLRDKNNKQNISDYRDKKFTKQEISFAQFQIDILRINSGL